VLSAQAGIFKTADIGDKQVLVFDGGRQDYGRWPVRPIMRASICTFLMYFFQFYSWRGFQLYFAKHVVGFKQVLGAIGLSMRPSASGWF